jgi:hypothetical protein
VREFQRLAGRTGQTRSFEVDWTLIADDDDKVARILVALRDGRSPADQRQGRWPCA